MNRARKPYVSRRGLIACLALLVLGMTTTVCAQPPGVVFPDYYPEKFSGIGRILSINEKTIVIDDQLYYLSPQISYHTLNQEYTFGSEIKPGMLVGYVTESVNVIVSLYYIQK